jgi:hypothetical protein
MMYGGWLTCGAARVLKGSVQLALASGVYNVQPVLQAYPLRVVMSERKLTSGLVVTNREEINALLLLLTVRRIRPAMVTSPLNAMTIVIGWTPGRHLALNLLSLQAGMVVGVLVPGVRAWALVGASLSLLREVSAAAAAAAVAAAVAAAIVAVAAVAAVIVTVRAVVVAGRMIVQRRCPSIRLMKPIIDARCGLWLILVVVAV